MSTFQVSVHVVTHRELASVNIIQGTLSESEVDVNLPHSESNVLHTHHTGSYTGCEQHRRVRWHQDVVVVLCSLLGLLLFNDIDVAVGQLLAIV